MMIPYYLLYWIAEGNMLAKVNLFGQKLSLESAALGIIMLVATLSIPIWNLVARKFNKRSAYISGMMFWIVVQILLILLKPCLMNLVLLFSFFAGFSVSPAYVMPESMFPVVIDWDELRTSTRHAGMYYGAINFMRKLSSALAIFITLHVLGWFGYQTLWVNRTQQPWEEIVPGTDHCHTELATGDALEMGHGLFGFLELLNDDAA